jgi:diadenosine tetraphosphate (Ap4A) HIT family hydrolase
MSDCPYCSGRNEKIIWHDDLCRVLEVEDSPFTGWCRVVWNGHVKEMTDLPAADRRHMMDVVFAVETGLRTLLQPEKVNLASLGTALPHVHWHIVPRFRDDSHFPEPVWAAEQRAPAPRAKPADFAASMRAHIERHLG